MVSLRSFLACNRVPSQPLDPHSPEPFLLLVPAVIFYCPCKVVFLVLVIHDILHKAATDVDMIFRFSFELSVEKRCHQLLLGGLDFYWSKWWLNLAIKLGSIGICAWCVEPKFIILPVLIVSKLLRNKPIAWLSICYFLPFSHFLDYSVKWVYISEYLLRQIAELIVGKKCILVLVEVVEHIKDLLAGVSDVQLVQDEAEITKTDFATRSQIKKPKCLRNTLEPLQDFLCQ